MRKTILMLVLLPLVTVAQNPIVHDQFTADPTARVFNNRLYLYPSHDIPAPAGQRQDWFCMADYHVFSSDNMTEWTDHGIILSQEQVPWGKADGYSMWAPDCVEKNGTYYFYYPNAPASGRGFAIGVATASRPEGPFSPEPTAIAGISGIDPCVLIDNDGQAYIYWSGMGIRGARLKPNMKEVDGDLTEIALPQGGTMRVAGQAMEGLPDGFKEGPFAFRRDNWYYLTFPWVRGETGEGKNPTETLAYAMSRSPLGPWDFKGIIMAEHDNGCWTNHHSLVEYQGQWYLFYHRNHYSPNMDKRRSACIERVSFNADGTIKEVRPTLRGVGVTDATHRIEIDRYSSASAGVAANYIDTTDYFRGWSADLPARNSWVQYNDVDFSNVRSGAYVTICAKAQDNTQFCIREKGPRGKVIARITMTVLSEQGRFRRDQRGQWLTLTAPMEFIPHGIGNVVVCCEGEPVSIDWLMFKNRPVYFSPVPQGADPARPDDNGFIRRWMLLEPIRQDIRSNVVFTNSWLRNAFGQEYFRDQMTMMPRNGQKVNAGNQKLVWHALDSENYNVKLFRFAEQWGQQTYGSLFWAVTIIDCPEEVTGVRLAAGSNGASIWWLNGEEVLLLEGDRRMVEDDGMSPRLTLRRGTNVLRCAVINGPGLSDMCVRFLHDDGTPVTNYKVKNEE